MLGGYGQPFAYSSTWGISRQRCREGYIGFRHKSRKRSISLRIEVLVKKIRESSTNMYAIEWKSTAGFIASFLLRSGFPHLSHAVWRTGTTSSTEMQYVWLGLTD